MVTSKSLWLKDIKLKAEKRITKNIETDILIIGGGITGLTTAYFLKEKNVVLIDQGVIGESATSYSTGKITYLQDSLVKSTKQKEDLYLSSQIEAMELIKQMIINHSISCDYESNASYLYATNEKEKRTIHKIEKILQRNHVEYKVRDHKELYHSIYSIKVDNTAVMNPAKYILGLKELLKKEIDIYEHSMAEDFEYTDNKFIVKVGNYYIHAKTLIVTTHYPFLISLGLIPFRTYIEKGYLLAANTDKNKKINAISTGGNHSLRYYTNNQEEYMVYSSCSKRLEKNMNSEQGMQDISWEVKSRYNKEPKYIWSNTDIMSPDSIPIAGKLENQLYIATGYSTWGLTNGTISAKIISDDILGRNNPYQKIFDPNRMSNFLKLIMDNLSTGKTFLISKIIKNYSFYKDNVSVYTENGKRYGKYIDENGKEHIVSNVCPHMKCNLIFNYMAKTWDCPCHSSRFDIDGNVLRGPSCYNIKVTKENEEKEGTEENKKVE